MATIQQRIYRDRALFKIHSDFIQSAVKGAMGAIDGHLHPLNPADPTRYCMWAWQVLYVGVAGTVCGWDRQLTVWLLLSTS